MIWQEGIYVDLWSVIHLLYGLFMAGLFIFIKVKPWKGFVITTILAIIWERVEWIPEVLSNQIIDIVLACLGYLLMIYIYSILSKKQFRVFFIVLTIILIVGNILGWIAIT